MSALVADAAIESLARDLTNGQVWAEVALVPTGVGWPASTGSDFGSGVPFDPVGAYVAFLLAMGAAAILGLPQFVMGTGWGATQINAQWQRMTRTAINSYKTSRTSPPAGGGLIFKAPTFQENVTDFFDRITGETQVDPAAPRPTTWY